MSCPQPGDLTSCNQPESLTHEAGSGIVNPAAAPRVHTLPQHVPAPCGPVGPLTSQGVRKSDPCNF